MINLRAALPACFFSYPSQIPRIFHDILQFGCWHSIEFLMGGDLESSVVSFTEVSYGAHARIGMSDSAAWMFTIEGSVLCCYGERVLVDLFSRNTRR